MLSAVLIYISVMAMLILSKPALLYSQKDGKFKQFGEGDDKTYFALPVVAVFIAIFTVLLTQSLE